MPTYYVDTSQTFNGDGTASTAAASDGAVGAANTLQSVLAGTHAQIGTLAAGDTVYIRTADAGGNLSETLTASLTVSTNATATAPVNLFFDDGTVWAHTGQFILTTNTSYYVTNDTYVNWYAGDASDRRFMYEYTGTATNTSNQWIWGADSNYYGVVTQSTTGCMFTAQTNNTTNTVVKDWLYVGKDSNNNTQRALSVALSGSIILINPTFDFSYSSQTEVTHLIYMSTRGCSAYIYGGKIIGGYTGLSIFKQPSNSTEGRFLGIVEGLDIGVGGAVALDHSGDDFMGDYAGYLHRFLCVGCGNPYNYDAVMNSIHVEFKNLGTYPTLNASLPDGSNTPWSYKIYPKGTNAGQFSELPKLEKLYTQSAAVLTFTLEFLLLNTLSADQNNLFVEYQYIDNATGDIKSISTRDLSGTALTTSTAAWTNTTYADFTYVKRKIVITTPTSVKSGTVIRALPFCGIARNLTGDFFFIDPDIGIA